MSFVASFSDKLHSLAEVLIQSFPEQFDSALFAQIRQQKDDPASHIGQIAVAVAMSDFVVEVWQKQPHFLAKCWQSPPHFDDCDHYAERLDTVLQKVQTEGEFYRALRQFRAREMVKLSFCQSLNLATVEQIFIRLSQLAESLIIGARNWLYVRACEEMGTPTDAEGNAQQLYILGMGKLGGFELNFSSDIDLIFTYPSQGETVGARRNIDNAKFFTRLGQRLINALDQYTADGFVHRTDMRLRPFGDSGALALSFNAMEQYYQDQGRDWERYAMIKGRILGAQATDPNVALLQNLLRPFVYRRYIDFSVIQALRDMKQKIEREVRRRNLTDNIKLGAGGIREVEFIVQVFQLIRGGREAALQQPELLSLLPELTKLHLISDEQETQLRHAYLFLRRAENVLQAIKDQQTQQLPENESDRQRLIFACAEFTQWNAQRKSVNIRYPIHDWSGFLDVLHDHQRKVRSVFQSLIGDEQEENTSENEWEDFLETDFDEQELLGILQQNGVPETEQDVVLDRLLQFRNELPRYAIGVRGRAVLDRLMPNVLQQVLHMPHCPILLPRILTIIEKILTRTTYLELLAENPQALTQLIELCAQSKFIAEQVARHPILLDELLDQKSLRNPPHFTEYASELQQYLLRLPQGDEEQFIDGLRQFKHAALLRIAAADILGVLPVMKVSDHLTYLAEAIIGAVVNLAWQQIAVRFGVPEHLAEGQKNFLVVGYGKLGGIELGYKSDLDLVFLYDPATNSQTVGGKKVIDSNQFYLRLAQKIVSIFSMNTSAGILYDVDMRLRPSGDAGLLGCFFAAFENYQLNEAWTWEKQALVRSRAVFGEPTLREEFDAIRHKVLAAPRDLAKLKQDVCEMRKKMYQHLTQQTENQFNIKTDSGGITDIEFIAQYLVLAHSPQQPALTRWSDNVRIFDIMVEYGVISETDGERLKQCYVDLRNRTHHLNLLGLPSVVNASEFHAERAFVQEIWARLFY
ncbi:bifunctional [glutamate--ammonia ligase]-adenylyl-L-tyrosine phosphorylase/[glutamate--ammonia-ligase] adenylyltransferase [Aggregatibacter actinomycetemcomitans]|uniref:bifunctional [glutamate--ammonia ligase]-adenylyl-L-tyrosine phosphorylase/[glutamate--ammonia-ligase] adenylyltransferase n=1 Tax=Aggregatibacter actinomycetemcomitans TaxID=714 RepID=UPI00197B5123|nr:bifunctional [glutamate--ammonia ligase]-adenylyl-L-tyrosine phosphorylase/[glutamate--ammonia-ligase] adenylyltransferase [Aggregatibacter actinomycetemcomitans]MBN6067989.1 bifunctional [glutamate--ammonia ligase]-adenylyl-L-tyrosine phosphorylase/[glutamate--ammonia-ligase] adenylyltransferase [Aggregatibacter actinomycetemcomitans]MBN6086698.1 bifunctional [glutamate--ammonia ligase]-adenylyl-L-tyrosine phosphorylase/[glutamate--ammonia-ligase] adenylyltransferase [Aggregatibacter actinomy